ncbi:MAG TPA: amidohydrolase family protein [Gemmatimonadales bacterium]|nr:amidohydrolase family protein [Gemmatimonadales bacterium]
MRQTRHACRTFVAVTLLLAGGCRPSATYDVVLRGGTIYDGGGGPGYTGDLAISGDSIAAVGPGLPGRGRAEVSARGLAVAPGFVNMLSWANEALLADGRSESDIRQGVTLEVFGEGESMGPLTDSMKTVMRSQQADIRYPITWTTLGGYLDTLVARGVSPNVASFVGATTVRIHELGYDDRPPTAAELGRMQALVRQAMEEGALGVGSSLIYAPASYARTPELVALARAAGEHGGMYISHIRSEGNRLEQGVDELLTIAREAGVRAEIYHLKAAGEPNWGKLDGILAKIDSARSAGLQVTADMYAYTAGATGLDASMPPWVQEGGYLAWAKRLQDPAIRARVRREMTTPGDAWENLYLGAGSPEHIVLNAFKADSLKPLTGKTLAEVARLRGTSAEDAAMDLVVKDGSRVGAIYFIIAEENLRRQMRVPWVSFGSDEGSYAPEGVFLRFNPHPRAYGNFARVLGRYVRDERLLPLEEAVRRLAALPAENLRISRRGRLAPGYFADVVAFDPGRIRDHATFERPHQYATGMVHVFVNGVQVLRNGSHTGAKPGRVVRGPGWTGGRAAASASSR